MLHRHVVFKALTPIIRKPAGSLALELPMSHDKAILRNRLVSLDNTHRIDGTFRVPLARMQHPGALSKQRVLGAEYTHAEYSVLSAEYTFA
jgi:hypothetical protein